MASIARYGKCIRKTVVTSIQDMEYHENDETPYSLDYVNASWAKGHEGHESHVQQVCGLAITQCVIVCFGVGCFYKYSKRWTFPPQEDRYSTFKECIR